jgi:hypothetical protein
LAAVLNRTLAAFLAALSEFDTPMEPAAIGIGTFAAIFPARSRHT